MDGYIKHSDLAKILRRLGEKGGRQILYDKRSLLKAINGLDEYSKPKYTIDDRYKRKEYIREYRRKARAKECKPYLYRFLEDAMRVDNMNAFNIMINRNMDTSIDEVINIMPTSKMLGELLQVSKPTLARWNKENAINPFPQLIEVYSVEGMNWIRKYKTVKRMFNLSDLENYIKSMDKYK